MRIDELCGLRGEHLDFARGTITVSRDITKTDAGERVIPMVPAVRETLLEHAMAIGVTAERPIFVTHNGRPNTTENVRTTVVDQSVAEASMALEAAGRRPIRRCTPHSLRRTFASLLAELGVPPRRAMYLLGHTDPKLTMGVYRPFSTWPAMLRLSSRTFSAVISTRRSPCCPVAPRGEPHPGLRPGSASPERSTAPLASSGRLVGRSLRPASSPAPEQRCRNGQIRAPAGPVF